MLITFFFFISENMVSMVSKKDFFLTAAEFSMLPQFILNELWPREDSCVPSSHICSLHDRVLTFIFGRHDKLCSQTIISGNVLKPVPVLRQSHLRVQRSQASNNDFQPCSRHTQISPAYLILVMELCTVQMMRYSKSSQFYTEEHFF